MPLAPTPRPPRWSRSSLILALYGTLALIAIGFGLWQGRTDLYRLGDRSTPTRLLLSPLIGVAFGLLVVLFSRVAVREFEWARVLHREFHSLVHELGAREIVLLAAASSIGEELFFRGALLPKVGLVLSSVLFAALHVRPHLRFLPWTAMSLIVGLGMGALYLQIGDLGGPIAAHFTINLLNLRYISRHELRA